MDSGFSVVVAASTNDEILKESFMELKIDELILQILKEQPKGTLYGLYDAIRVLLTPDDTRVLASQVSLFTSLIIADQMIYFVIPTFHCNDKYDGLLKILL